MDQRSLRFETPHVGRFESGVGVFHRDFEVDGQQRRTRITFTRPSEAQVDWELAMSSDNSVTWTPLWRMEMRRIR
jgi:hypothetical protein